MKNLRPWLAWCVLLGCSSDAPPGGDDSRPFAGQQLNVFNWSDYLDPELIPEFERRTGARVQYDNYASEAELEAKLLTGGGGYDVVVPSDRSLPALLAKDLLAPLDPQLVPNRAHLDPKFLRPPHDPENRFSLPYFWGTVAIGVRRDQVSGVVTGFEPLFDERYRGRITMLDDAENVVAVALLHLGHPLNSTDEKHLAEVRDLLVRQRPLVQAYTSDAYRERLIRGDAWVALGWSGDLLQAAAENDQIQVLVPAGGTMLWVDSLAVPRAARNPALAHAFLDFLLDPEIAARNAAFVRYGTPNAAAKKRLAPALLADPAIYPPQATLDRSDWLKYRGAEIERIEKVWREVRQ